MRKIVIIFAFLIVSFTLEAKMLEVGEGKEFLNIQDAALQALPGDTIFVYAGVYQGGMFISQLQGTTNNKIYIIGEHDSEVIIRGGNNSIHFTNAKYIEINGLIIEQQTANGMNIDDGGDYATPAQHIRISNCIFRNINANGNNDLLKLSGVDNFTIENCTFENGAAGGSGIDMVGCHYGLIQNCHFSNMGSNAIQAKGGTQYIEIYANYFNNCGQRTLNLGGSTGLDYFRPIDAQFEAADLQVYCNIFIGSLAPIAFVGSVRVAVINNTIINPERWILRILQETVDENRFEKCGNNRFENNLIYFGNISTETNIGPNTASESFVFKNNFWYNHYNPNWQSPNLPVVEVNQRIGTEPIFEDVEAQDFRLSTESTARLYISYSEKPFIDYQGNEYQNPRSAGAFEYEEPISVQDITKDFISISPNPACEYIEINLECYTSTTKFNTTTIHIYNTLGELVITKSTNLKNSIQRIDINNLSEGVYFIMAGEQIQMFVKQ
jgi:hypothetical protein